MTTGLVDDVVCAYVEWREGGDAAACAYRRWADAPPADRDTRFFAFTAALDQEEAASTAYAESVRNLERWLSTAGDES